MDPRVLVAYHTSEGQTAKIVDRIASCLRDGGLAVDVFEVTRAPEPDGYDAVVVGDSIHAVHHSRGLVHYLHEHATALDAMPTALFQVSLTSTNPDADHTAAARAMVDELEERTGYHPKLVALFAGALKYTKYGFFERRVMRSISRREGGDTDMHHDYEYTDWDAVDRFAADVDRLVRDGTRMPSSPG
jgi:menaquinone-dependent protoporphyrinogen oxidase